MRRDTMTTYTVNITIERQYTTRANALSSLDAILAKVPTGWTVKYTLSE